jgi:hypothetical protein
MARLVDMTLLDSFTERAFGRNPASDVSPRMTDMQLIGLPSSAATYSRAAGWDAKHDGPRLSVERAFDCTRLII